MDLSKRLLDDLDDVTTLYERKLCSLGVVQLTLARTASASRLTHPEWVDPLQALAARASSLESDKASWMEGMALMDAVRQFVKKPAQAPRPRLSLVGAEPEPPAPAPEPEAEAKPPSGPVGNEGVAPPPVDGPGPDGVAGIPDDPTEPAVPSLVPRRTL